MSKTETNVINVDVDAFIPATKTAKLNKNKRKPATENDMELGEEEHRGVRGRAPEAPPKAKKSKATVDDEAKKDMRKISVPAHR